MNIDLERRPGEGEGVMDDQGKDPITTKNVIKPSTMCIGDDGLNIVENFDSSVNSPAKDCSAVVVVASEGGDENLEPYVGMEFESHEIAFEFYKYYARREGFGVCKRNSRRSRCSNKFIDAKFVCCRYGTKQASDKVCKPRPTAKIDCKAAMHVKRRADGTWYVYSFVKEHNHELLQEHSHFFRCHKDIAPNKDKIRNLHSVGVMKSEVSVNCGGYHQSVCCLEDETRNDFGKERRLDLEAGDAQAMHEFFIHMQEENPNFFYALDLNENQHLRNVFWVDAKGRHDYINFNDVVSFDTTYVTNGYRMPIVPFVGVNHHGQFMLIGCALIADVSRSTFLWLMKTWFRAMDGQAPKVLITDQDKVMKEVVAEVFPNSKLCFSLWQIMRKISDKLGHVIKQHESFIEKFNKCIYKSWTDEEFERRWWKMVDRFELRDNEWIQSLYEDHKQWVPTYMREIFFAGMSTSQRCESINSFFDKYVTRKTTLKEFVEQYEVALHDRCEKEAQADFESWQTTPPLKSPSPYEKQMSSVYTRELFKKFQVEIMGAHACHPVKEKEDEANVTFRVTDLEQQQDYTVIWNETKLDVSCSCRSFQFKGFLCRHAMIVLQFSGVFNIPSHYILKRWTKDAKNRHSLSQRSNPVQSRAQRYNDLCKRAIGLAEEGSLSQESYNSALRVLEEGIKKCVTENDSIKSAGKPRSLTTHSLHNNGEKQGDSPTSIAGMLDPQVTKRKGGPKKIQSGIEKTSKKRANVQLRQEVQVAGLQQAFQVMGQVEPRAPIVASYYGTQENLQKGRTGFRESIINSCCSAEDSLQKMGQWELRTPAVGGYYGTHRNLHAMGPLGSRTQNADTYYCTQENLRGMRNR